MALKFAVAGSTGMIGSAVCDWLSQRGHTVTRLVRPSTLKKAPEGSILWDAERKLIDLDKLEGYDAVINLAGVGIADKFWTPAYKSKILESRVESTHFLADSLRKLRNPPKNFFSASAIGFYGEHPSREIIDEGGANGHGFLAEVTKAWETATKPADMPGTSVTLMRFGIVLDKSGGALAKMLPVFKSGFGGAVGSGNQMLSWISLWEIPQIIYYLTLKGGARGPVNFTAPKPVNNREFAQILGEILHRPTFMGIPEFMVNFMMGEMGRELLLKGASVTPRRLLDKGYHFAYPDLRSALIDILK